jgi:hypothetical protein
VRSGYKQTSDFLLTSRHHDACYDVIMKHARTTVTLDPDIAEQLKEIARRRNVSFTAALNSAIRAGLAAERGGRRPYRTPSRPMGLRAGIDLTKALQIADALEDEEIVRRLELRK